MRRFWVAIRDEKPGLMACMTFMGFGMAGSGSTGVSDPGPWGWFNLALLVAGVAYLLVFSTLWVIVARRRRQTRANADGAHEEPSAA